MAIKDWKQNNRGVYHTNNYGDGHVLIGQLKGKKGWYVSIVGKLKKFKTKKQALTYAKAYMRKH